MKQIEAVIFDWAGTTVDYGCMAPIQALQAAFTKQDLQVTLDEIRKPMGILKLDHIKAILNLDRIKQLFQTKHGRDYQTQDVVTINAHFETTIFSILHQHADLIPGILDVQDYLRTQKIKIGSTTGYTRRMIDIVSNQAKTNGYEPDHIIAADEVAQGRPFPHMIKENLALLGIQNTQNVIKVGDTIVDIEEGKNAGCYSVGVIKGSSMLGLTETELSNLAPNELTIKMGKIKNAMLCAGADYVLESITELPWLIHFLEQKTH